MRKPSIQLPPPHDAIYLTRVGQHDWGFFIQYRGPSVDALLAAGCIDFGMAQRFKVGRKGACRTDVDGDSFVRRKRPTKAEPERCTVIRYIQIDRDHDGTRKAMALPGVRDYLAEHPAEPEDTRPRIQQAAERMNERLGTTTARTRTRAVGRFQRPVSWITVGELVFPDWPTIGAYARGSS